MAAARPIHLCKERSRSCIAASCNRPPIPAARRAELVAEYTEKYANPYSAAERRLRRRRDRSGRDTSEAHRGSAHASLEARKSCLGASTGTCRCDDSRAARRRRASHAHRRGDGGDHRGDHDGLAAARATRSARPRRRPLRRGGSRAGGGRGLWPCDARGPGRTDGSRAHHGRGRRGRLPRRRRGPSLRRARARHRLHVPRHAGAHAAEAPRGDCLCRFATVNDVHFGETECGVLEEFDFDGPVFSAEPGEPPYPEMMNSGAIAEIAAIDPGRSDREGRPHRRRAGRRVRRLPPVLRRRLRRSTPHRPRQPRRLSRSDLRGGRP